MQKKIRTHGRPQVSGPHLDGARGLQRLPALRSLLDSCAPAPLVASEKSSAPGFSFPPTPPRSPVRAVPSNWIRPSCLDQRFPTPPAVLFLVPTLVFSHTCRVWTMGSAVLGQLHATVV